MAEISSIGVENGLKVGQAVKELASAGLTVQSYCVGLQQQQLLLLPADLQQEMPDVNGYIRIAQANAGQYLNKVQPNIIAVISDVGGFSTMFPVFAEKINGYLAAWSSGSEDNKKKALEAINGLKQVINEKGKSVLSVSTDIGTVQGLLSTDVSHFDEVSNACANHITGDKGELAELEKQISSINGRIAGASVGVGLSGLAIVGGVFVILIGSIASFVTAGTSTSLVVAGGIIAGAGVAGLVASSVVLAELIKSKGDLLRRKAMLDNYVLTLEGCKSNVDLLSAGASEAADKLVGMKNAWDGFGGDLAQVEKSIIEAEKYSKMPFMVQSYFETAQKQWEAVNTDIDIVKKQMAGVEIKKLPSNMLMASVGAGNALGEFNVDAVKRMVS